MEIKIMATYIQRKGNDYLETVDEFESGKEARAMVKEYRMADPYAEYYLSKRPCKAWREKAGESRGKWHTGNGVTCTLLHQKADK